MRKKINSADKLYIEVNCLQMDKDEIAKEIDLNQDSFEEYYDFCVASEKTRVATEKRDKGYAVLIESDSEVADASVNKFNGRVHNQGHIWRGDDA